MNKQYIYPQNMRASATLWLWSLKDFEISEQANKKKGEFIRDKRKKAGITQRKLASLVHLSNSTISAFENNKQNISVNNFNLLCDTLDAIEKEKVEFLQNRNNKISEQANKSKGEFIRDKRKKAGITQLKLASLVNMDNSTLSAFEINKRNIGINNFNLLCDALNVDEKEKEDFLQNERKRILEQLNKVFPCDTTNMTIGEKVLYFRVLNNLTQAQLAKMSDIPARRIKYFENNIVTPRKETIIRLSKALGVDLNGSLHCVKTEY